WLVADGPTAAGPRLEPEKISSSGKRLEPHVSSRPDLGKGRGRGPAIGSSDRKTKRKDPGGFESWAGRLGARGAGGGAGGSGAFRCFWAGGGGVREGG